MCLNNLAHHTKANHQYDQLQRHLEEVGQANWEPGAQAQKHQTDWENAQDPYTVHDSIPHCLLVDTHWDFHQRLSRAGINKRLFVLFLHQ